MELLMKDTKNVTRSEGKIFLSHVERINEIGGPNGLEPTRYGGLYPEWEKNGRVSDF
jgi:hypothetical protein